MQINKETIEQLFRQHYLRMYQLARVLLKDDAASKDVVSEVFADVLDGKTQLGLDNETIASNSPPAFHQRRELPSGVCAP